MLSAATAARGRAPIGLVGSVRRGVEVAFCGLLPLVFLGLGAYVFTRGFRTFDFWTFWHSGRDVLHGRSPYPTGLPHTATMKTFRPFVYPAPAAVVMVPFALLPFTVADVLFALIGVAALVGALHLVGIRDWRCYGAAFLSWPFLGAVNSGTITPLLVLGAAALWVRRDRPWAAGVLLASLVAAKLFLWPLGAWLVATRRLRASAVSVTVCVLGSAAAWAVLGFAGLRSYPHLLGRLTDLVGPTSYSPYALALALGADGRVAHVLVGLAGAVLLVAVFVVAGRSDGDRRSFSLALAAALALSPVVWPHYLALLFVVIALAWPRLALPWFAPVAFWLITDNWSHGSVGQIALALVPAVGIVAAAVRRSQGAERSGLVPP